MPREEVKARIEALKEPYKLEILDYIDDPVTVYRIGDQWGDLCSGSHLEHTGDHLDWNMQIMTARRQLIMVHRAIFGSVERFFGVPCYL